MEVSVLNSAPLYIITVSTFEIFTDIHTITRTKTLLTVELQYDYPEDLGCLRTFYRRFNYLYRIAINLLLTDLY